MTAEVKKIRKLPKRSEFKKPNPNVGFYLSQHHKALEKWAEEAEEYIKELREQNELLKAELNKKLGTIVDIHNSRERASEDARKIISQLQEDLKTANLSRENWKQSSFKIQEEKEKLESDNKILRKGWEQRGRIMNEWVEKYNLPIAKAVLDNSTQQ